MTEDILDRPSPPAPNPSGRGDRIARRILVPLLIVLIAIVAVFYVVFTVTAVQGDSMLPTLRSEDRLLTTKSYTTPRRGDIVVFRTTGPNEYREDLIKRVIAIAGDTVSVQDGVATVNGVVEDTSSLTLGTGDGSTVAQTVVENNTVFVLGDNRPIALDSRDLGGVPLSAIRGRAVFVFAPIDRIRTVR